MTTSADGVKVFGKFIKKNVVSFYFVGLVVNLKRFYRVAKNTLWLAIKIIIASVLPVWSL